MRGLSDGYHRGIPNRVTHAERPRYVSEHLVLMTLAPESTSTSISTHENTLPFFLFRSNLLKDHIGRQQSNKGTNGYLQKYYIFLGAKYCWNYFSWNMCVTAQVLSASLITNLESQGQSQAFCQPWGTHILSSFLSQRAWECPAPDINRNVMSTARYIQSVNTQIKWWLWI